MTNLQTSTLRPGLLVSLKTSVRGNVAYRKNVITPEHLTAEGRELAKWETERTIADPKEHEAAQQARTKASALIRAVCARSAFGLLCPESEAETLDNAMAEARKITEEFNATAKLSRLSIYVITGRIAPDDVEAVKAINGEVRDLMADMQAGIEKCDPAIIRAAAARAKEIGSMLSENAETRITIAIETARNVAKKLVKAGDTAALEVDRSAIRKITECRTAFLDLDEAKEIATPMAAPARAIDLVPQPSTGGTEERRARRQGRRPQLDLE